MVFAAVGVITNSEFASQSSLLPLSVLSLIANLLVNRPPMLVVNICGSSLIVCYTKPVLLDGGKAGIQAGGMIIVGDNSNYGQVSALFYNLKTF